MKIMIDIECETIMEVKQHLHVLSEQISTQCRKFKLDPMVEDFAPGTQFSDDNCYGIHELNVLDNE